MRTLARYAFRIGTAAALLAGCSGSQPIIGGPAIWQSPRGQYSVPYKVMHRFLREKVPDAALIDVNGTLYGTTYGYSRDGTVYILAPSGVTKTLYRFHGSDGAHPQAALLNVDGTLYGTTSYGGSSNDGVVFSVTTSGTEKVLYSFKGGSDGANPYSSLIDVNGTLYGTTYAGGGYGCNGAGCGTVYSIGMTGTERVLHSFTGAPDGQWPYASLVELNNTLYSTTYAGGAGCGQGCGTVFSITKSGVENVVYAFKGSSDGAYPKASLVAVKGRLYGTTYYGGGISNCRADPGCGAVFSIKPTGDERVLHRFEGESDGSNPSAPLIDVKGTLYGTTLTGGSSPCGYLDLGCGTLYSINGAGSERVLHRFTDGSDGAFPFAGLVSAGARLYGTTTSGGSESKCLARGCGTVFAWSP